MRKIAKSHCGKSENFVFIGKLQIDNVPDTVCEYKLEEPRFCRTPIISQNSCIVLIPVINYQLLYKKFGILKKIGIICTFLYINLYKLFMYQIILCIS